MAFDRARRRTGERSGAGNPRPLMKVVGEATRALPDLARDLKSGGFGHGSRGLARDLYLSFTATIVASRGTEAESMAWALGRALALDLNRIGAREESLTVLRGLIDFVGIAHADKAMLLKLRRDEETIRRELGRPSPKPIERGSDRPPDRNFSWKAKVFKTSASHLRNEPARTPAERTPVDYNRPRVVSPAESTPIPRAPTRPAEPARREPSLDTAHQASHPGRPEAASTPDKIAAGMSQAARTAQTGDRERNSSVLPEAARSEPANTIRAGSPKSDVETAQPAMAADAGSPEPKKAAVAPPLFEDTRPNMGEPAKQSAEAADEAKDGDKWAAVRSDSSEQIAAPSTDGPSADVPPSEEAGIQESGIEEAGGAEADPRHIEFDWEAISNSAARAEDWSPVAAGGGGLRGDMGRLTVAREDRALPPLVGEFRPPRRASRRGTAFFLGVTTAVLAALAYGYSTHNWKLVSSYVPGIATAFTPTPTTAVKPPASAPANPPSGPAVVTASNSAEKLPPPGAGRILSMEEVRYCIFQGRRLSELRNQMTGLGGNDLVDRYNDLVTDFNGRCRSFRYEKGVLETVQREEVEKEAQLKADASAILAAWRPAGVQPQPVKATEPQVTEESLIDLAATWGAARVQMRLMDLGFYRGTIDGVWGPQSKKALKSFKQNNGLGLDDNWDIGTQAALLGRES
jgi:hypothetical protein